jgi:hypothetical protein
MEKSAYLPALSVFALAAIAPAAFAQVLADRCYPNAASCRNVRVTVQGNQVTLDPPTITVSGRGAPVVIVWYLATPGYTFATPGPVAFPAEPWINRYQFDTSDGRFCYWWQPGTAFVCQDRNYATLDTEYKVKVVGAGGSGEGTGRVVNN